MIGTFGLFAVVAVALFAGAARALPPQKIVAGDAAVPGEFPYIASLRHNGQHFCGGTIVSPRHIVTAAHCMHSDRLLTTANFRVATGSIWSTGGNLHDVAKVVTHPNFIRNKDLPHDLSIVVLATPIMFNAFQHSLALPTGPTPGGVIATAAGWGHHNAGLPIASVELMKVQLQTLTNAQCQGSFNRIHYIQDCHICTFNGYGMGTCQGVGREFLTSVKMPHEPKGDSGGPLAYNGQLIGVVSFGIPCGVGYPDVFTNVYQYASWISTVIATE